MALFACFLTFLTLADFCFSTNIKFVSTDQLPSVHSLTDGCVNALTSDLSCNAYVQQFRDSSSYQEQGLVEACTDQCSSDINNWQTRVSSACVGQTYAFAGELEIPVISIPDTISSNYQLACVEQNGHFCNVHVHNISQAFHNNNQTWDPCDDCLMAQMQIRADSAVLGGAEIRSAYSVATANCSKTNFPLTHTFATSTASSAASSTPTCAGKVYKIQSGDDCHAISKSQCIDTTGLLADNNLPAYCADFPTSGDLCLINHCEVYTVQETDTCPSIARSQNITITQLLNWNPILGATCGNIKRNMGMQICRTAPGEPYNGTIVTPTSTQSSQTAVPVPSNLANGTVTNCARFYNVQPGDYCNLLVMRYAISLPDFRFLNLAVNENCTNLFAYESYCVQPVGAVDDYPGHPGYIPPMSSYSTIAWTSFPKATFTPNVTLHRVFPLAPGTWETCVTYSTGRDEYLDDDTINQCTSIAESWGVDPTSLEKWNPSLKITDDSCKFDVKYKYCVQAADVVLMPPSAANSTANLTANSTSGSTTNSATWPPAKSTAPSRSMTATASASGTSLPRRDGTWTNCTGYADVDGGMTCQSILDTSRINIAQFYAWNSDVGDQCQSLWQGYRYCVRIAGTDSATLTSASNAAASTTSTTSQAIDSTANSIKVPDIMATSKASDMSSNQAPGTTNSPPAATSSAMSGTTNSPSAAAGLAPGPTQSGQPGNCNKWYVVKDGDGCYSVEQSQSVSEDKFKAWNPAVVSGTDCVLWKNYAYCVGLGS